MDSLLSVAGSITSIVAAIWSFNEAKKSANSATKAENVKNELIDRRRLVEVSKVLAQTERILGVVSKIGPSCHPKRIASIDCSLIAKEVEEYSRFLNSQQDHFFNDFDNKANLLCQDLIKDIEELSEAVGGECKKIIGSRIYYKINEFMPFVKKLTDGRQENSLINKLG